jgi:hypothetical protein
MNYCWWFHRRNEKRRIAHLVESSRKFLGMEIYTAYCGKRTIHNDRKEYGKMEDAIGDRGRGCMKCWDKLPYEVLMEVNHLPVIKGVIERKQSQ